MSSGIGAPACHYLNLFGQIVADAFDGERPYHVGSSATSKEWRDVDVRLMLDDDHYERLFGPFMLPQSGHPKWVALCMAFSELGRSITGLPIDFQIQQITDANKRFSGGPRIPLAMVAVPGDYMHVRHRDGLEYQVNRSPVSEWLADKLVEQAQAIVSNPDESEPTEG